MMDCRSEDSLLKLNRANKLWLLLDYDGTLADFASTPDTIIPDPPLVELLTTLSRHPGFQLAVVSGRRLAHIRELLPIPGIWLAGTYGIEILSPDGELIHRQDYDFIRSRLEIFKPEWEHLLSGYREIYLEDKGWALAIHASKSSEAEASRLLSAAQEMGTRMVEANPQFRILGGNKFLEICPQLADKGRTVRYLLETDPLEGSLPVYIGDDDKDEAAFAEIESRKGLTALVSSVARPTQAQCRFENPYQVRAWLTRLSAYRV